MAADTELVAAQQPLTVEQLAYHEAGHAVAAYLLHRPLHSVTIVPDGEVLGMADHEPDPRADYYFGRWWASWQQGAAPAWSIPEAFALAAVQHSIMRCLAGPVAEARCRGIDLCWMMSHGDDYESAQRGALSLTDGDEDEAHCLLDWLQARTERMLDIRWRMVECVARGLIRHQRLSGKRVEDTCRRVRAAMLRHPSG